MVFLKKQWGEIMIEKVIVGAVLEKTKIILFQFCRKIYVAYNLCSLRKIETLVCF